MWLQQAVFSSILFEPSLRISMRLFLFPVPATCQRMIGNYALSFGGTGPSGTGA